MFQGNKETLKLFACVLMSTKSLVWLEQVTILSKQASCPASLLLTIAIANLQFACF